MRISEELPRESEVPFPRKVTKTREKDMDFAGFIDPGDGRWVKMLKLSQHDFYHLPEYVSLAGEHENGHPTGFYAECGDSAMLIPVLVRRLPLHLSAPDHWCDISSPYGYPSPLYHPGTDRCPPHDFLKALKETAFGIDAVCGFFRLHPLIPLSPEELHKQGTLVRHGQTVIIDLQLSDEEIWRNTRGNHRDNILRLKGEGFTAIMDDWSRWDDFISLYHETMDRLKASSCYCFSDSYFEKFRSALGPRLHLCTIFSPEGEVAASGLITAFHGIVQFHLAATSTYYLDKAPSKLLFDSVRRWAQQNGERYLHLGGGVGGQNDSLFRFKAGFSKGRADFHTFRMIFNQDRYDQLVLQREDSASEEDVHEFFPLYRK
jgi:hypothetical protein